jgi:hypothetical protein
MMHEAMRTAGERARIVAELNEIQYEVEYCQAVQNLAYLSSAQKAGLIGEKRLKLLKRLEVLRPDIERFAQYHGAEFSGLHFTVTRLC